MNFYVFIKGKAMWDALMHVFVREHIVSHSYRTAWLMFTIFCRDDVLMVPCKG